MIYLRKMKMRIVLKILSIEAKCIVSYCIEKFISIYSTSL